MNATRLNSEVFTADDKIVKVGFEDMDCLKNKISDSKRGRIRLCAHKNVDDYLHEMFIMLSRDTYIRPHKHASKSESVHVIEGTAHMVLFDDDGNIVEIVSMGNYESRQRFFFRISDPVFHAPLISSEYLIFHETINGPFRKSDTIFAPWAPEEDDTVAVRQYLKRLRQAVDKISAP